MKIGLLSDTHGYFDPAVFRHFESCDELWHAGDLGDGVLDRLQAFCPVRAVFGNIDSRALQTSLPEDLFFTCEGVNIWMTHIGGVPPNYNPRVKKILKSRTPPDIFICGHSHILRIKRDPGFNNMLYINPGAAGNHGFHAIKTLVRFTIDNGQIGNMEVIELGKRGALTPVE